MGLQRSVSSGRTSEAPDPILQSQSIAKISRFLAEIRPNLHNPPFPHPPTTHSSEFCSHHLLLSHHQGKPKQLSSERGGASKSSRIPRSEALRVSSEAEHHGEIRMPAASSRSVAVLNVTKEGREGQAQCSLQTKLGYLQTNEAPRVSSEGEKVSFFHIQQYKGVSPEFVVLESLHLSPLEGILTLRLGAKECRMQIVSVSS
jgi:hypothetical protein